MSLLSLRPYEKCDRKLKWNKLCGIYAITGFIRNQQHSISNFMPIDVICLIFQFYHIGNDYIEELLSDITDIDDPKELLMKKVKLCGHRLLFSKESLSNLKYNKAIETKKKYLIQIIETFQSQIDINYDITDLQQLFDAIKMNIFRPLPPYYTNVDFSDSKDNINIKAPSLDDGEWIHLRLIYELLLRLVINTNIDKIFMKKLFILQPTFLQHFIELFASSHIAERSYLKTILYRIYARHMALRSAIRKYIANYLYAVMYDDEYIWKQNGICELLEIYQGISAGFARPLMSKHIEYLLRVIIPLHKCRKIQLFHSQLTNICVNFIDKESSATKLILCGLLRYWPLIDSNKELLFIEEVEQVITAMINHQSGFNIIIWNENKDICLLIIDKLIECNRSYHTEVAEKSLSLWQNEYGI